MLLVSSKTLDVTSREEKGMRKHLVIEGIFSGADKGPINNSWTLIYQCWLDFDDFENVDVVQPVFSQGLQKPAAFH